MKTWKPSTYLLVCLQSLTLLGGLVAAANIHADDKTKQTTNETRKPLIHSLNGADIFRAYCASCHGIDATGNGPAAPALIAKVPDLTTIAQRNGGVFPSARVRKVISGEETIIAHGSREMPVWGPIFHQVEEDRDYGDVRLHNVTDYLQSLQRK
jgi:mono/diheme cytochrome c family protein